MESTNLTNGLGSRPLDYSLNLILIDFKAIGGHDKSEKNHAQAYISEAFQKPSIKKRIRSFIILVTPLFIHVNGV